VRSIQTDLTSISLQVRETYLSPIPGALITGANPAQPTQGEPFGPATRGSIQRRARCRLSPTPALWPWALAPT